MSQRATEAARRQRSAKTAPPGTRLTSRTTPSHPLLVAQRKFGNQAVLRSRDAPTRPQLQIGAPDSPLEREADVVAARVMRGASGVAPIAAGGSAPGVQRKCAGCGECAECKKDKDDETLTIHRRAAPGATGSPRQRGSDTVGALLHSDAGKPLDAATRGFFEPRFGQDFSGVRVHTGARATESAKSIDALAYTAGDHIVFRDGQFSPATQGGKTLLAHELAHVVQQSGATGQRFVQRQIAGTTDPTLDNPPPGRLAALPPAGLYEEEPVRPAGELIKFENVLLSTDALFVRYQLEQMIAADGFPNARRFVERLVASPSTDRETIARHEQLVRDIDRYGRGDVSGTPEPPVIVAEIRHRIAARDRVQRVIAVVQREFRLLRTEGDEFLADFERIASEKMFEALRISEERVVGEAQRYGFSPSHLPSGTEASFKPVPASATNARQAMRGEQADAARYEAGKSARRALIEAAADVLRRKTLIMRIESELRYGRTSPSPYRHPLTGGSLPLPGTALDIVKEDARKQNEKQETQRLQTELDDARRELAEFLREKQRQFPILAAFTANDAQLKALATQDLDVKAALLSQITERLQDIAVTRQNMRAGRITPWDIEFVIEGTRRFLKVDNRTLQGAAVDERHAVKRREKADQEAVWHALGTLSFALTIAALIPTPATPFLLGAGMALNATIAVHDVREYMLKSAAAGTDFDKALAISQEDPSLFWLAFELVGLLLDVGLALKSLHTLSTLKRAVVAGKEGAVAALEAEARQYGPRVVQRLVEEAEAARRAALAQARAGGTAAEIIEEETIKAARLAEETFELGGHTYQILKDGRVVRCSKYCTTLSLLFGELFEKYPHLSDELAKLKGLKGKAAAEGFARLSQRMELVGKAEAMSLQELEKEIAKYAKGTAIGEDLRYVRYRAEKGALEFEDWLTRSRGGRGGGPEHQARVAEILKKYPTSETEAAAADRFADAFTPPESGKKAIYHQVGGTNLRGDPIARERRAIDDIRRSLKEDCDIIFYPKDPKLPPLVNPDRNPSFALFWFLD